ncbi:MAG: hypothetical protein SNF33_06515 [Candidatus Algichlamydia australiensis]|nr:hypothetical protein [Chlamydiales bacterium]
MRVGPTVTSGEGIPPKAQPNQIEGQPTDTTRSNLRQERGEGELESTRSYAIVNFSNIAAMAALAGSERLGQMRVQRD